MSQGLLSRMLKRVIKGANNQAPSKAEESAESATDWGEQQASPPTKAAGKRKGVFQILTNVTDGPVNELRDESTLDDLGIDSLMTTEVVNDIRSILGLTIDLLSFLFLPNIHALVAHVNEQLGVGGEEHGGKPSGDASDW